MRAPHAPRPTIASVTLTSLVCVSLVAGCGADDGDSGPSRDTVGDGWTLRTPEVLTGMPAELRVGENVTILGKHFVAPERGRVLVRLEGIFFEEDGDEREVARWEEVERIDEGELRWRMWPDVTFSEDGDELGNFVGALYVVNQAFEVYEPDDDLDDVAQRRQRPDDDEERCHNCRYSEAYAVDVEIGPSLIVRRMEAVEGDCDRLVDTTLEEEGFFIEVKAVGFDEPSDSRPLRFLWGFDREHWKMEADGKLIDTEQLSKGSGYTVLIDEVHEGTSSYIRDGEDNSRACDEEAVGSDLSDRGKCYLVKGVEKAAQIMLGDFEAIGYTGITELRTRSVEDNNALGYQTTVVVGVEDASGQTAELNIPLDVTRGVTLHYDKSLDRIVERETPFPITGCTPAGDFRRHFSYNERFGEHRSRSAGWRIDSANRGRLGFIKAIDLEASFGVNVRDYVGISEEESKALRSEIIPRQAAVIYAQWVKFERIARVDINDQCGLTIGGGEAYVEDWKASLELATGRSCHPLPKTHLPENGPCYEDCAVDYSDNPSDG